MKKLFFIIAFFLLASISFAQSNSAIVNQFGTNLANIEQSGGTSNSGEISQGSLGSPVTNTGSNLGGDWKFGAFIRQIGSSNQSIIDMNSSSNGASIYQNGLSNQAYMELNAPGSYTTSFALMGLDIDQDGNFNYAKQKTVSSFGCYPVHGMRVDQDGNYNSANQLSIGGRDEVIEIIQNGNNNNNPTQSGNPFSVSATGLNNPLLLPWAHKPSGDYTQYTNQMFGKAHINILGSNNNTAQYQEYRVWSLSGRHNAAIDITGSANNAAQGQLGESNNADLDISGSLNIIGQSQWGDNNNSVIIITGSSNIAGSQQEANSPGNSNQAHITISGSNNTGTAKQIGNSNEVTINQTTNSSIANLVQNGDANTVIVTQKNGDINKVNLKQDGGADADIMQDGGNNTVMGLGSDVWGTSLNNSHLDVDQLGNGNTLHLQQTNGASATVMQNGATNTSIVIQN